MAIGVLELLETLSEEIEIDRVRFSDDSREYIKHYISKLALRIAKRHLDFLITPIRNSYLQMFNINMF